MCPECYTNDQWCVCERDSAVHVSTGQPLHVWAHRSDRVYLNPALVSCVWAGGWVPTHLWVPVRGVSSHPPSASFKFKLNSLLTFPGLSSTMRCGKGAGGGGQSSAEAEGTSVRAAEDSPCHRPHPPACLGPFQGRYVH